MNTEAQDQQVAQAAFGVEVIAQIRRMIVFTLLVAGACAIFVRGGSSQCLGGIREDGTFIDDLGNSTDDVPQCLNVSYSPSFVLYATLGVIVLVALSRVMSRAIDTAGAVRIIHRASVALIVVGVVAIFSAYVTIMIFRPEFSASGYSVVSPFPFVTADVTLSDMLVD